MDYLDTENERARNISYMIYCANTEMSKREPIHKFWPLFSDKKVTRDHIKMTREMYQEIKKYHLKHLN